MVEELALNQEVLEDQAIRRFEGLMKYMRHNSDAEERTKQVLVSSAEVLVPEEYDEVLRAEFERRCSFGERLNTELMHSGKWVKLLRDINVVLGFDKRAKTVPGVITLAEADIIFHKVLHNCDYGNKRLTYDLFCKAICLVAGTAYPNLEWEAGMGEILAKIAAKAPEEKHCSAPVDHTLDPNVVLVLDSLKTYLHDLFKTLSKSGLANPASASVGSGAVRLRERSFWKHTQDTLGMSVSSTLTATNGAFRHSFNSSPNLAQSNGALHHEGDAAEAPETDGYPSGSSSPSGRRNPPKVSSLSSLAMGTTGGYQPDFRGRESCGSFGPAIPDREKKVSSPGSAKAWSSFGPERLGTQAHSLPYGYVNGAPVIKNRIYFMSAEQLLKLAKELKIMPELLSRQEMVRIFKRAQITGTPSSHGSTLLGYLTREAFVEAAGQMAIEAYSKEPFCEEYPSAADKVRAFWQSLIPGSSLHLHDKFLYGCTGRGR